jgi:hypothetical protein
MANGNEARSQELTGIYQKLKVGLGHELVNDENVHELILMASQYGDSLVETLLREWQSSCGDDNAMPMLKADGR